MVSPQTPPDGATVRPPDGATVRPPDGVTVRAHRADERAAVRDVVVRAFGDPVVGDLAEALLDGPAATVGASFVADLDGQPVGHVQLSRSWLDAAPRLVEVLVLSPLAVDPRYQRRGIGARLVRHAVDAASGLGAPLLFLEGSPSYYARFGFEPAARYGFTPPSVRIPAPAFQVVTLPAYEPWMTGALVYAEVFWAYDCVGLRGPDAGPAMRMAPPATRS